MRSNHLVPVSISLLLVLLALPAAAKGKRADERTATPVPTWLVAGPAPHLLPVFADDGRAGWNVAKLLEETALPEERPRPAAERSVPWFAGSSLAWRTQEARRGVVRLQTPTTGAEQTPAVAWLACYVGVDRWRSFELRLDGTHPRRAWLDGQPLLTGGTEPGEDEPPTAKVELQPGRHLLLVATVRDPARDAAWEIGAALVAGEGAATAEVEFSLDPRRDLEIRDVLDPPQITSVDVSPDGARVAASVRRIVPGTHESESWIEIRRTADGTLEASWRGAIGAREVAWSPDGRYLSYLARAAGAQKDDEDKKSDLLLYDLEARVVRPLLRAVERLDGYRWGPTGTAIVYSTTVAAEKDERGVKLLEGLLDRWATYRDKQYLSLVTVPAGARRRLTAGALSTTARDISPDGRRLLFTRQLEAPERRPYTRTELWELDLVEFRARRLREFGWLNDAAYAPDGRRLLITAPADAFGEVGVRLPPGSIPNAYDGQLFVWEPATDTVEALTREFDPAVRRAVWHRPSDRIHVVAEDRAFVRLYRYEPGTRSFVAVDTTHDVVENVSFAQGANVAAVLASSPWEPQGLVAVDVERGVGRRLAHPADGWFDEIRTGRVEPWSFTASSGRTIEGRVYLPPGFDPGRRYPAIAYYYGGTSPVGREFGGRYPKELWAARGYVVWVSQPSGATGFGQEFAARHVNDWGKTTSQEILEGTRRFLDEHPFVDPARVGCIGASYGGFMTMLLATQSDRFAAAVAHAGISSIASYWGEGYWGFLYNAVAAAESFPWSDPEIYVEQSPLYRADRARVPILLTHGVADTNVPVGESDAFYIALKLLGKQVEYLQVEGQDHWIVDHAKRIVWNDTILAWFDRHLRGQPEWWNALYPGRAVKGDKEQPVGAGRAR